jgi:hypothetical protein
MALLVVLPQSSRGRIRSFPCRYHSTMLVHAYISPGGWTIGQLVAAVQRRILTSSSWSSPSPPPPPYEEVTEHCFEMSLVRLYHEQACCISTHCSGTGLRGHMKTSEYFCHHYHCRGRDSSCLSKTFNMSKPYVLHPHFNYVFYRFEFYPITITNKAPNVP